MGLRFYFLSFVFIFHPANAEPATALIKSGSMLEKNLQLPSGFQYQTIASDSIPARPDMNVLSPDGRFLYTSHEIFDQKICGHSPSLSRIDLVTNTRTILIKGICAADGLKWTPWNTLLLGQEKGDGLIYEVDPDNGKYVTRARLGTFAHEGIAITPDGIVYLADEHSQGAIYKFIPDHSLTTDSLASGTLYALSSTGWITIDHPENARQESIEKGAVSFNRPEDMEAGPDGKIYIAVTGEDRVIRIDDSGEKPVISDFIKAESGIRNPDNLVFHPNGDLYILQDIPKYWQYMNLRTNGIWIARPDKNNDNTADEIILFARWAPVTTEPSGAVFSSDGKFMYINKLENDSTTTGATLRVTGFR
ncbi:MAG: PhoX family protein [Gammaproteobacteria bacterium]|nr:PhoX family protein [Gammaproteobacteria bacterium]